MPGFPFIITRPTSWCRSIPSRPYTYIEYAHQTTCSVYQHLWYRYITSMPCHHGSHPVIYTICTISLSVPSACHINCLIEYARWNNYPRLRVTFATSVLTSPHSVFEEPQSWFSPSTLRTRISVLNLDILRDCLIPSCRPLFTTVSLLHYILCLPHQVSPWIMKANNTVSQR